MQVEIGNPFAIEGYRIPESDDPEKVHYKTAPGERVTTLVLPDDMDVIEAVTTVVVTLPRHLDLSRGLPAWIESSDPTVKALLCQHYGINENRVRPPTWESGLNGPYPTPTDPDPKPKKEN